MVKQWVDEKEAIGAKARIVWDKQDLKQINVDETDYLMGLFGDDWDIKYEDERDPQIDPSLADMTKTAIEVNLGTDRVKR